MAAVAQKYVTVVVSTIQELKCLSTWASHSRMFSADDVQN